MGTLRKLGLLSPLGLLRLVIQIAGVSYLVVIGPIEGEWSVATGALSVLGLVVLFTIVYRPKLLRPNIWVLSGAVFAVVVTVAPSSGGTLPFYEASAQIIPILFVVLAIELRAFRVGGQADEPSRRAAIVVAMALLIGGYQTLKALVGDNPGDADFDFVVAALAAASVALFCLATTASNETLVPGSDEARDC